MRNILVLPNGDHVHFMYPASRDIEVNEPLEITLLDDTKETFTINEIIEAPSDKSIYYFLK